MEKICFVSKSIFVVVKYTLEEEYDYDFRLVGISCHAKDYRLCWCLNRFLGLGFVKDTNDLEIIGEGFFSGSTHSMYSYYDEEDQNEFYLIANRDSRGYLLPEQKQADFLLMIKESLPLNLDEFIKDLRSLDLILTSFEIDVEKLKSKENLIF
jgi:hypothetical protein